MNINEYERIWMPMNDDEWLSNNNNEYRVPMSVNQYQWISLNINEYIIIYTYEQFFFYCPELTTKIKYVLKGIPLEIIPKQYSQNGFNR